MFIFVTVLEYFLEFAVLRNCSDVANFGLKGQDGCRSKIGF